MLDEIWITYVDVFSNIILGIGGILISWAIYQLTQQRIKETWIRTYAEFHEAFWTDGDHHEVRCWLAYPAAYKPLRSVLIKRRNLSGNPPSTRELNKKEYEMLDKLDKYLNTIMRAVTINPEVSTKRDLWDALHFKYWLNACLDRRKPELSWYVEKFYRPLYVFGHSEEVRRAGEEMGFER